MQSLRLKTALAFGLGVAFDKFVVGETDMMKNAIYAGSLAVAVYGENTIVSAIETQIPSIKSASFANEKQMTERAIELATVAGTTHALNSWVLNNEAGQNRNEYWTRMAASMAIDWLSEKGLEYINGTPMSVI